MKSRRLPFAVLTALVCAIFVVFGVLPGAAPAAAQQGPFTPQSAPDIAQGPQSIFNIGQAVGLFPNGDSVCTVSVQNPATGTPGTGTLTPQVTLDGTNWQAINLLPQYGSGTATNAIASTGIYIGPCGGVQQFRVLSTAWTSGTWVIIVRAGIGPSLSGGGSASGGGGGSVTQGTNPWVVSCASGASCPTNSTLQSGTARYGSLGPATYKTVCGAGCDFATATTTFTGATILYSLTNADTNPQTASVATCSVFDNTAASGSNPFNYFEIGPGQTITFAGDVGVALRIGLTVSCAQVPSGKGLTVVYGTN